MNLNEFLAGMAQLSPLFWELPIAIAAYAARMFLAMKTFDNLKQGKSPTGVLPTEYERAFLSKSNSLQWIIAHRGAMATATWYWFLAVSIYAIAQHFEWLTLSVERDWGGLSPWVVLLILHAIYRSAGVAASTSWSAAAIAGVTNQEFANGRHGAQSP